MHHPDPNTEIVISPPSLYLLLTREHLDNSIEVAAQNVFDKPNGAFTGEISVSQLKDCNITWTLLGHSERRTILRESDEFVAAKAKTSLDGGVGVILCCGESLEQREKGVTNDVVMGQLKKVHEVIGTEGWKNVVIAYEPIWAIGTGKVASTGAYYSCALYTRVPSAGRLTLIHRTSTRSPHCHPQMAFR